MFTTDCFKSSCLLPVATMSYMQMYLVLQQFVSRNCHTTHIALTSQSSSVINLVYSYKANQTRFKCSVLCLWSYNRGLFFSLALSPSTDSAYINIILTNSKQDVLKQSKAKRICYIFWVWVIIKALLKQVSLCLLSHSRIGLSCLHVLITLMLS